MLISTYAQEQAIADHLEAAQAQSLLSQGYESTIMRGDPATRKFAVFYLKSEKVIAVDAINSAPEFMVAKKMILSGKDVDTEQLADMSVPMKDIMASL